MYQSEDGTTKINVRMANETVWLSQAQMAELFQTTPQKATYQECILYGELYENATCKEYLQVQMEGTPEAAA